MGAPGGHGDPGAETGRGALLRGLGPAAGDTGIQQEGGAVHVPRRCVGVLVQALLREEATRGRRRPRPAPGAAGRRGLGGHRPPPRLRAAGDDPGWWAARLLQRDPAAGPRRPAVRRRAAAARGTDRHAPAGTAGRPRQGSAAPGTSGPGSGSGCGSARTSGWNSSGGSCPPTARRPSTAPPGPLPGGRRPAARRRPRGVQPLLCRWFTDERTLRAEPGTTAPPTVAGVAQALLYTHRDLAVDDLCEALVATAHPGPRNCSPASPATSRPPCAGP